MRYGYAVAKIQVNLNPISCSFMLLLVVMPLMYRVMLRVSVAVCVSMQSLAALQTSAALQSSTAV